MVMPGGNGTGPMGAGPMTGRRMGRCAGFAGTGFGYGRGIGCGRGRGNRFWAGGFANFPQQVQPTITKEQQLQFLQQEAQNLEEDLKDIKAQIEQLNVAK
jgi:hypothetical protein